METPAPKKRPPLIVMIIGGILLGCGLCFGAFLLLGILNPASPQEVANFQTSIAPQPTQPISTSTAAEDPATRCVPASQQQIEFIRTGVKGIKDSNDVTANAWAVRSDAYERVWFVAAELSGPGIEPKQVIGIWAINGELDDPHTVLAVDGFAQEFSIYTAGDESSAGVTMFDDGAQEAKTCAMNN